MRGFKNKKKWLSTALVASLLVISACSNNAGTNNAENKGAENGGKTNTEANQPAENTDPLGKYAEPITLTTAKVLEGDVKFKEGENIDNNVLDKTIEKDLNIKLKYLWTAASAPEFTEKVRLALSANQELPDMLTTNDTLLFAQLVQSGKYQPVDELFDKYAIDNWKKAAEDYPETWAGVTIDGKKYGLPTYNMIGRGNSMWIREDWLKKLNLKAPATIEELETVLDAFTNKDPDGNGKKDTFGTVIGPKNAAVNTSWLGSADVAFNVDGVISNDNAWFENADGKLYQPLLTPAAKTGLQRLQNWMKNGYMPKDSGIYDEMKAGELFTKGQIGVVFGAYWLSIWPFPDLLKNVPGSEFKAYPYPTGKDGTLKIPRENPTNGNITLIKKDVEHPEAVIKYMNWFYKNYLNADKGSIYEYGLAKGYDWDEVDGQPTNDKSKLPNYIDAVRISVQKDYTLPGLWVDMLKKFTSGGKPETPIEVKQFGGEDANSLAAAKVLLDYLDKGIQVPSVQGVPITKTMLSKNSMLDKIRRETISKIIYGEMSVDQYDKFLEDYNKAGYGKIVEEVNEWYAKNKQ
ncbi:sugar ABC transporter [Paenibacillus gansuensis]|uniref:Sugar ABC transporter n=1 Tax=Paenibacillus gansuensis TaxID=306542 RepID=A0ABW5PFX5_9BACL